MKHISEMTDQELFVLMYLAGIVGGLDTMVKDATVQAQLMAFRVAIAGDEISEVEEFIAQTLDAGESCIAEILSTIREKLDQA